MSRSSILTNLCASFYESVCKICLSLFKTRRNGLLTQCLASKRTPVVECFYSKMNMLCMVFDPHFYSILDDTDFGKGFYSAKASACLFLDISAVTTHLCLFFECSKPTLMSSGLYVFSLNVVSPHVMSSGLT